MRDKENQRRLWREWHKRHPEKSRANRQKNKERVSAIIDALKARPCTDCGNTFPPVCMDFDHLDSSSKVSDVSRLRSSRVKALAEIAKCDLVCANCHRIRTAGRLVLVEPNGL